LKKRGIRSPSGRAAGVVPPKFGVPPCCRGNDICGFIWYCADLKRCHISGSHGETSAGQSEKLAVDRTMHACAMDLQVLATDFSRGALGHVGTQRCRHHCQSE